MQDNAQLSSMDKAPDDEGEMDLFDHIRELRSRLLIIGTSVILFSVGGFLYSGQAFSFLSKPFHEAFSGDLLIGTGPSEAFILRLKVAVFLGFLISLPVIFHQLWKFVEPGLYEHEKKLVIPFVLITSLLFLVGVWFCYDTVMPFAFEFFRGQYEAIGVTPTIRISEHLSLLLKALIGFGVVFEMPVLAFILGRLGIINHHSLIAFGRYAIVLIFIVAAILTPPDVLTQFLLAGPLLLLYGLSILILRFTARKEEEEP